MAKIMKKKEKRTIDLGEPYMWFMVLVLVLIFGVLFFCAHLESQAYKKAASVPYEERYNFYEIVSVDKYIREETNVFGAVLDTEVCYNFSYVAGNNVYHVDKFIHYNYGNTKVIIGDSDCYMVSRYTDERYLQLTKETFNSLSGSK
jgi:hypothetical protein